MAKVLIGTESLIQIPRSVAVCPYCQDQMSAYFTGWTQNKDGTWRSDEIQLDCESEPDIDSDEWEDWERAHSVTPYVYQLPVEERVMAWVNQHFIFEVKEDGKPNG